MPLAETGDMACIKFCMGDPAVLLLFMDNSPCQMWLVSER